MPSRKLNAAERLFAYKVFESSVRYDAVSISDAGIEGQVITTHFDGTFTIRWKAGVSDIMGDPGRKATFIHEMTHVWQGCSNGTWSATYQVKSIVSQVGDGVRDIIETNDYRNAIKNWDQHRSVAYRLDASHFGRAWNSFNVEQQANIVETWYIEEALRRQRGNDGPGVFGADMSPYDARFPYIRDIIRRSNPSAPYRPVRLPAGGDHEIKRMQDALVSLGYLAPRYADGLVGRTHSATLDAVSAFQTRNGLKPDRQFGGLNSDTRKALLRPVGQLRLAR